MKASLFLAVVCVATMGCAGRPLVAPHKAPPPMANTSSLNDNINDIDRALQSATTRTERIKILVEALSFKEVVELERE